MFGRAGGCAWERFRVLGNGSGRRVRSPRLRAATKETPCQPAVFSDSPAAGERIEGDRPGKRSKLFELAREAFRREVAADPALNAKARRAAERAVEALLLRTGFHAVRFVESLPAVPAG